MGKHNRVSGETKEERRERKRIKKEEKKQKKLVKQEAKLRQRQLKKDRQEKKDGMTLFSSDEKIFFKKTLQLTISLLPSALRNVQKSIEENFASYLLKYSDIIGGIMLAFEKIEIIGNNGGGIILDDLPYIHYTVSADALVFSPAIGCKLKGVVTESFPSHISLVVFQYFNASVPAEQLREAGFEFDRQQGNWYDKKGPSSAMMTEQNMEFVVKKIHESGGIISLDGAKPKLTPE